MIDKNKLEKLYKKMSVNDIVIKMKLSHHKIYKLLNEYNISKKPHPNKGKPHPNKGKPSPLKGIPKKYINVIITKKELEYLYLIKKLSGYQISELKKWPRFIVYNKLREFNIKVRNQRDRKLLRAHRGKDNYAYGKVFYKKTMFSKELKHYIRSTWEEMFGKILQENNIKYKYEPKHFNLGDTTYTPDFYVKNIYFEIKGYLSNLARRKIKKFLKLYPNKKLIIVGLNHFTTKKIFKEFNLEIIELFSTSKGKINNSEKKKLLAMLR